MRSIRAQILALLILSTILVVSALSIVLFQLQRIGILLDELNIIYLPLAEELGLLDTEIQQLKQQQQSISWDEADIFKGNYPLYIQSVELHLERTQQLLKVQQQLALPDVNLNIYEHNTSHIDSMLKKHNEALNSWDKTESALLYQQLLTIPIELSLSSGRLLVQINHKIQLLGEETAATRAQLNQISIALSLLSIALILIVSSFALRLLQPLQHLTELVKRIGAGAYGLRLKEDQRLIGEELQVLSTAINQMAEAVEDRDRELFERADVLNQLSARLQLILDTMEPALLVVSDDQVVMANPAAQTGWKINKGDSLPEMWKRPLGKEIEFEHQEAFYDLNLVALNEQDRLISVENVTLRVQNRGRLLRAEQLALVGKMLAQVTHEVRNPLSAMSLNAELLLDEQLSEEGLAVTQQLIQEIGRLETITERYLRLSRRRSHQPIELNPETTLLELQRSEDALLNNAHVSFIVQGKATNIYFDPDLLKRVLLNLIRNAIDANASELIFSFRQNKLLLELDVQDNGIGMDPSTQQAAFEPFFTTKPKGTGLGLAICQQELETCGAQLLCLSSSDKGTTFSLKLPIGL